MDYNVVSKSAKDIVSSYFRCPETYEQGLKTFYTEGKKNPSVARILYHNEAIKNGHECIKRHKLLSKEFDEFKPSAPKIKGSDFKPDGIMQEIIADSAAGFLNVFRNGLEELTYKRNKLFEMQITRRQLEDPINILDKFNPPENIQKEKEAFDSAFSEMYPKTGEVRKRLIKYNIRADRVTPRMPGNLRHFITEPKEGWFSKKSDSTEIRIDVLSRETNKKPELFTNIKNFFKSEETLKKEEEARFEQQKKEYENKKLARALKP